MKKLSGLSRKAAESSLVAIASSVGLTMVIATFMGLAAGYWLDRYFDTKPWLLLIGLMVGLAAGFKNIFVILDRLERRQKILDYKKEKTPPLPDDKNLK